jgi:hypothetical protein
MKVRASVVAVAVLLSIAFAGLVLAQGFPPAQMTQEFQTKWGTAKARHFEGTVVSHDVACHCFVIKGAKGNLILQDDYAKFEQEYDKAKGLKVGEGAMGTYKTIDGINYATEVHQK